MNKIAIAALAAAAAASLAACEDYYGPDEYAAGAPYYYDGYYDDFYGAPYGGYWGPDGFFYYQTGPNAVYMRDDARHFRREAAPGFHSFHMRDIGDHEHHEHAPPGGDRYHRGM